MTKTLTEQWRDGTLPDGHYYVRYDKCSPFIKDTYGMIELKRCVDSEKIEVLSAVPSYDEHNHLQWSELVEKAKELGYRITNLVMGAKEALVKEYKSEGFSLYFTDNGEVFVEGYDCYKLAGNRTLEQMVMIMEALNDLGRTL